MSASRASAVRPQPNQPVQARPPQQERGQRRVDAILAAAAAIVAEDGVQAATMHAIAKRSGTTVGSMYHFFPDREAVLVALGERHARALGALAEELTAVDWKSLPLDRAVSKYVDAVLGYVSAHPDLLPVGRTIEALRPDPSRRAGPEQLFSRLARTIVESRTPGISTAQCAARAAMILAAAEGVVERGTREPKVPPRTLRNELKSMLVAYLGQFERR
jgi:AcrR family transcriptional regulator